MSDMFEKAWYDNVNPYTRHIREDFQDSVRQPGITGPTGMDRARFIEPNRWYRPKDPDYETGWSGGDLPLKIARLSLEQNKELNPTQLLNLAESEEDIQWMIDNGHLPALFTDSEAGKQARIDLRSGAKTMEDLVRETLKDGYKPAGTYDSGYFMPDNVLQGLDVPDRMRAVINARLMDVPVEQLRQLVDRKTSAPKLMEDWHYHTKPYGSFSSGEWQGYTPLSRGAKATTSKNLTGLGVESPLFRDLISRLGKNPEALKTFRRLLSAEASDLLNTMEERRNLDSLSGPWGRNNPFGRRVIGPEEDMGDIKIREEPTHSLGSVRGPFEEDFQIMNRSNDAFEDAWKIVKFDDTVPSDEFNTTPNQDQIAGIVEDAIANDPNKIRAFGGTHGICPHCGSEGPKCFTCGQEPQGIAHMVGDEFVCDECLGKTCLNLRCEKPLTSEDYVRIAGSPNPQYTKDVVMDEPWEVVCGECDAKGLEGIDEIGEFGCCEHCEWCWRGFADERDE